MSVAQPAYSCRTPLHQNVSQGTVVTVVWTDGQTPPHPFSLFTKTQHPSLCKLPRCEQPAMGRHSPALSQVELNGMVKARQIMPQGNYKGPAQSSVQKSATSSHLQGQQPPVEGQAPDQ